ncbi:Prophage CP4-57 regulatory protein (AlpA) [compost metagenome]
MMRFPDVQAAVGLGKSTIYSMVKAGEFPAPVKLGVRAVAWPSHLVNQWLADRMGGDTA